MYFMFSLLYTAYIPSAFISLTSSPILSSTPSLIFLYPLRKRPYFLTLPVWKVFLKNIFPTQNYVVKRMYQPMGC